MSTNHSGVDITSTRQGFLKLKQNVEENGRKRELTGKEVAKTIATGAKTVLTNDV